jgi:putative spermidine/putrescine transport system ATP-binding protein
MVSGSSLSPRPLGRVPDVVVRFRGVQKTYDGINLVVQDLNLDLYRGEFLTLLGPSGSGKTTTLMMLAGFEAPTRGDIYISGKSINGVPAHKRNIGMVFQNYALFPHMTVWKNLAFPLEARKLAKSEIARRISQALEIVQLGDLADRRPAQLSGGQAQRVALARALVFEPALVLMDEPLGALDRQLRESMQYEIKRIHDALGVTVVYVTHDQNEALTMSDRIAVFDKGAIQQLASPQELYERPQNAFVAGFVGENNRVTGRLRSVAGDRCIVEVADTVIEAVTVAPLTPGRATMLSLRPERIVLGPASNSCANRREATVREIIYVGDHIRLSVEMHGGEIFIVKVPNAKGRASVSLGDRVSIGWSAEDCYALDAAGG